MIYDRYLFDSNCLITANRIHYSYSFCPAFWEWILEGNKHSTFFILDKVADELKRGREDDYLRKFIESHDSFILDTKTDSSVLSKYADIQIWANTIWSHGKSQNRTRKALEVFAKEQTADPWLIAYASVYQFIIISNEEPAPASQTSVKIPDVASAFGVEVKYLHEVLTIHARNNFCFKP